MRSKNLFHRMTSQNENSVTELLCNLMSNTMVRHSLLGILGIDRNIVDTIQHEHIDSQASIAEQKRPDIIVANDQVLIFIEIKVRRNVELQSSQISIYPGELKKANRDYVALIFLIPKNYASENSIQEVGEKHKFVRIVYWEDVMKHLYDLDIDQLNPAYKDSMEFIEEVIGISQNFKTFSSEELIAMNSIKDLQITNDYFLKLEEVFQKTGKILAETFHGDFSVPRNGFDRKPYHVGTWICFKGEYKTFIGYSFDISNEDFRFSYCIDESLIDNKRVAELGHYQEDNWFFFKIDKYWAAEENVESQLAVEIIKIVKLVFLL